MAVISQAFRCFDMVARKGSIRKAAEALFITATAVNQQILNLEEMVGTQLFDRVPRGMKLTTAGEVLIVAVRRGQREFDNALSQIADLKTLRRGHITFGVSHSTADQLLPGVIQAGFAQHPGITYSIRCGSGETLLRWVADGDVDVAYCMRRPSTPPGVEEIRILPIRLGVAVQPDHPLAAHVDGVYFRDCVGHPLAMMSEGTEIRSLTDQVSQGHRKSVRPLVETDSVSMVRQLAQTSGMVGFLISSNVHADVERGDLVWRPLLDAGSISYDCLYERAGQTTSVATAMTLQILEAAIDVARKPFEHYLKDLPATSRRHTR
jgi:DNA-binding transcriptional LysR family regulator